MQAHEKSVFITKKSFLIFPIQTFSNLTCFYCCHAILHGWSSNKLDSKEKKNLFFWYTSMLFFFPISMFFFIWKIVWIKNQQRNPRLHKAFFHYRSYQFMMFTATSFYYYYKYTFIRKKHRRCQHFPSSHPKKKNCMKQKRNVFLK